MKIRKGFVSNSSSSSFIISAEATETKKMLVTIDISKFGKAIKNEEELVEYMEEQYGEYNENGRYQSKQIKFAREAFAKGRIAFFGDIDNDAVAMLNYLDNKKYDVYME